MASGGGVVKVIFQGFYSPKESSLKNSTRGPIGRVAIITLSYELGFLRGSKMHPAYSPKERFLKNLSEGSHLFECSLSFILLISKFYPATTQTF